MALCLHPSLHSASKSASVAFCILSVHLSDCDEMLAEPSHTVGELIFDFIQIMPNDSRARVQKRLVVTPTHAKLFLRALQENIDKYEDKHDEIKVPQRQSLAEQLFGSVKPEQDEDSDE